MHATLFPRQKSRLEQIYHMNVLSKVSNNAVERKDVIILEFRPHFDFIFKPLFVVNIVSP